MVKYGQDAQLYFLILLLMLLLVACGQDEGKTTGNANAGDGQSQQDQSSQPNQGGSHAAPKENLKPTEVHFLSTSSYWWKEDIFMKDYGEPLQKKYPHIIPKTIPLDGINQNIMDGMITNKQPIDVILAANASYLVYIKDYDLYTDIEPYVKEFNIDLNRFAPEFIEMNRKLGGGKLIGLPLQDSATQVYYNRDIFDKFGLDHPPHDRWTWDEMFDLANKVTRVEDNKFYYGLRIHVTYLRRNQFAMEYIDPVAQQSIFNTELGRKVAEVFLRQYEKSDTAGLAPDGARMFFEDRVLAMWMPLGATYNTPDRFEGLDWDLAPVPISPELGNVSVAPYPDYMYLSKTSENKGFAMQAIEYFTSDDFQMINTKRGYPSPLVNPVVLAAFGQDADLYHGKNTLAMSPEKYAPGASYDRFTHQAAASILVKHIHTVRDKKEDLNTAFRAAEEEVNQYIKEKLESEK